MLALLEDLDLLRNPEAVKTDAALFLFSQAWLPSMCDD
jgi:hypothetical protein